MDLLTMSMASAMAKKYTDEKLDDLGLQNMAYYFCGSGEYNTSTGVPTVSSPDGNTFYFAPAVSGGLFNVYVYKNSAWTLFTSVELDLSNAPVDNTLSIAGMAADAKKTGDEIDGIKSDFDESAESMAPLYSASSRYYTGALVRYDNNVYRCKIPVTTPEAWNSSKWEATSLGFEINDLIVGDTTDVIRSWLDVHPEATTTVDFNIVSKVHNTVQSMVTDTRLKGGDNVRTNGYFELNDGGGCFYNITSSKQRACAIELTNGLFANPVGDCLTNRQIGIFSGDNGQDTICEYIADTSFSELDILDPLVVQKKATGNAINNIELIKIRRDNFTLRFDGNGSLFLVTNGEDYYRIIAIAECNNINIINPVVVGDSDNIGITTGEYGHGIYIRRATNITISSPVVSKCFGDAIDVGDMSEHIQIIGLCRIDEVRRNGISISHADNIYVENIYATNILGTNPKCAVDIEANNNTQDTTNIRIGTIHAKNCGGAIDIIHVGNHVTVTIDKIIAEKCTIRALGCSYIIAHDANSADTTAVNENNTITVSSIKAVDMANVIVTLSNLSKSKTSKLIIDSIDCINYTQTSSSGANAIVSYNYQNTSNIMNGVGRFTINRLSSDTENVRFLNIYRETPTTFNFDDIHIWCDIPSTILINTNVSHFDNSTIVHNPKVHDFGAVGGSTLKQFGSILLNAVYNYSAGFYNIYGASSFFGYFTGFARTLNQTLFISVVVGSHNLYITGTASSYTVYDNGQELE